ncbi:unnamed protein product [Mytilus coruscus]|uniref:Uncharacterized protein n=1 Tax=Mytilus coruscus TaxID=42192 RepID=A0A6J8BDI0_MYTCO|nr:unnamed protein product [Mytilus coruscus]
MEFATVLMTFLDVINFLRYIAAGSAKHREVSERGGERTAIFRVAVFEFTLEKWEDVETDIQAAETKEAVLKKELDKKKSKTKKESKKTEEKKGHNDKKTKKGQDKEFKMKVIDTRKKEIQRDIDDKVDVNKAGKKKTVGSNICAVFVSLSFIKG